MYTLKCGCGKTTTIENIGDSKDGFDYESFNGGFYFCPTICDDMNVEIFDEKGIEVNTQQGLNRLI